ncbi:MAG TPA: hypothetical protein QGF58_02860 [Myxococcota bacterium]|nr:hypothetical protein [Myxococcota bacterium]
MEPNNALVLGGALGALVGCGVCAAIAIPNFVQMQYRAKRAEVPANIAGLMTAELAFDAAFDEWVFCPEPFPRPIEALGRDAVEWPAGSCYDELGWAPDGQVRGTYWVEERQEDWGFVVHGMIDLDRDGVPAHYTATKSMNATMLTPTDVY